MLRIASLAALSLALAAPAFAATYQAEIKRDDWGIAHVTGQSDADAVFGMIYAQAEDDFNRIELNYLTSLGRRAEAEGEALIFSDLRQRLWIDPADLKVQYAGSPRWLRALMQAWAAGLNQYLADHPEVKPKVITRFEPWMALSFSEGSIGGDIESVSLTRLQAFYEKRAIAVDRRGARGGAARAVRLERLRDRPFAQRQWPCPAVDQPAHQLLLPLRAAGDEPPGPRRVWRRDLGAVLHLPGLQPARRVDAHLERGRQRRRVRRDGYTVRQWLFVPPWPAATLGDGKADHAGLPQGRWHDGQPHHHHLRHASRPGGSRGWRQVDCGCPDEPPGRGAAAELPAHQGRRHCQLPESRGAQGQLVQQHAVRGQQGRDRVLPSAVRAAARRSLRLLEAG